MQFVKAWYWSFYFYLCFERVIGDFGGVAKKCDGFTFVLAALLVQWQGSAGLFRAARKLSGSGARTRRALVRRVCSSGVCFIKL